MDREFEKIILLAHHDIDKPLDPPLPSPDILDILSWGMITLFCIGVLKNL